MTRLLVLALTLFLMAQEPWTPEPGNPGHHPPPAGWNCSHTAKDAAHQCACQKTCEDSEDGGIEVREDGEHCKVWCFKDHCHCPVKGCP